MANSFRNLLICSLASLMSPALAAQSSGCHEEVVLDSGPFVLDGKTNLINVRTPKITQCSVVVTADEMTATANDFEKQSGEWRFMGNVRVAVGGAVLSADSAVFTFADKRLARGELAGAAKFEDAQTADSKEPISGGAGKLVYDYEAKTLQLSDNAWVHKPHQYDVQGGCDLIYDLNEQRVTSGSAACGEKNRIRVLPHQDGEAPAAAPAQ
ncbi:MAG TPA: LptA/OstA family protein [Gammaproteobacteria bacterium]|jgi:lipopolysaccharide transport protein LptA|nr:LptA/OstA family protein [Gammaproteobacteria bacterium]